MGRHIYKSDTNWMYILRLLCFMVCEQIKGALSLRLAWRMILYCYTCVVEWCGWFSWWKALGFHTVMPEQICYANSHNFLTFGLITNIPFTLIISWLLILYAQSTLSIMANCTCMSSQGSSARSSWSVV